MWFIKNSYNRGNLKAFLTRPTKWVEAFLIKQYLIYIFASLNVEGIYINSTKKKKKTLNSQPVY